VGTNGLCVPGKGEPDFLIRERGNRVRIVRGGGRLVPEGKGQAWTSPERGADLIFQVTMRGKEEIV